MDKLIISAAIVGSWPTREQTPFVPITPEEIGASALEAWREGASIVHIHVRDETGKVSCRRDLYERVVVAIRKESQDVIVNLSTGGGSGQVSEDDRLTAILLRPEMTSLDAGSVNSAARAFVNTPSFLERLTRLAKEMTVKVEIECFESGMIFNALRLAEQGLIDRPYWFQFVLGVRGGAPATAKQLLHMVEQIPAGAPWSVCGIGRDQLTMNVLAIPIGGHVRTGLEDNIYYRKGELATGNGQLVARLVRIARECGRDVASPNEARAILGLRPRSETGMC